MGDHDHSYKLLFAHPRMVRDLLEAFVGGEWIGQLDFRTLERVSGSYVSEDLRGRADDIVWRVRCGDRYVYLLIEFQSSVEPFMAVRVQTYVGLLYQDLLRANQISEDDRLPVVLPIVLYNGRVRWRAAEDIASLIEEGPAELESYRARSRYLLLDEGCYSDFELRDARNFAATLFRLENCRHAEEIPEIVGPLVEELTRSEQADLGRAFRVWLRRVVLARLSGDRAIDIGHVWEGKAMLSERFDEWEAEFLQRGRAEGRRAGEEALLRRQLEKRFGELPAAVVQSLHAASSEQLAVWAEQLLDVKNLNELFEDASAVTQ
jgi:predicted transposase YdaD